MAESSKTPAKAGGYKEKMLKLPEGPEEISEDATKMYLLFELPYEPTSRKHILVNGGTDTLTVEDLTATQRPSLAAFVKSQCPKLERITLHFKVAKEGNDEDLVEQLVGIFECLVLLPDEIRLSIRAEFVFSDAEERGPKSPYEELDDSNLKRDIPAYFRILGEKKGKPIEFEDG